MKKRNLTPGLIGHLNELRDARKSADRFVINFLTSIQRPAALMRFLLANCKIDSVFQTGMEQYLGSLVTCWETFFRDIFVFLCEVDKNFLDAASKELNSDYTATIGTGITPGEFLSKQFNFQNIDDIEKAFRFLFDGEPVLFSIGINSPRLVNRDKGTAGWINFNHSIPGWIDLIVELLRERHRITHNSNYRSKIKRADIQRGEAIFLFVPQILGVFVNQKYGLPTYMISVPEDKIEKGIKETERFIPYLFTFQDLLSEEWAIANETEKTGNQI